MVYFTEHFDSKKNCLVILQDKDQPIKHGVFLPVEESVHGRSSTPWPRLENSSFLSEWSKERFLNRNPSSSCWILESPIHNKPPNVDPEPTLGRRIIAGEVRWGPFLRIHGEFFYTPLYWEWLELAIIRNERILRKARLFDAVIASLYTYDRNTDVVRAFCEAWCPSTNTLHISSGEISISLWDMWKFGGLSIKGKIYDEVVPSWRELTPHDNSDEGLPKSCEFLFAAYYHIACQQVDRSHIPISSWIAFWFKGTLKYVKPPARKSKKTSRPRSTHNPNGNPIEHQDWTEAEKDIFHDLGVEDEWKEKTYLAAFLSCWLCIFVFPDKHNNILRPGVFKVASLMAEGYTFSLAVPVLANIYHGLAQITNASSPSGRSEACLPMHYVYGWLAHYFHTHYKTPNPVRGPMMVVFSGEGGAIYFSEYEARDLIHKGGSLSWHANIYFRNKSELLRDDGTLEFSHSSYHSSIRSCYLSLRYRGFMIIESYNPCRFGRQFGFYQDVPNDLGEAPQPNLANVLKSWRICTRSKTLTQVYFPARPLRPKSQITSHYTSWWCKKHGSYLEEGVQNLVESTISPPCKPKLPKSIGADNGGKRIRISDAGILSPPINVPENNEESRSSSNDHHWKRAKKAEQPLVPDNQFFDDVSSTSQLPDDVAALLPIEDFVQDTRPQPSAVSMTSPNIFDSMTAHIGNCEIPPGNKVVTPSRPAQHDHVKGCAETPEISVFPVYDVLSNIREEAALKMWETLQRKLIRTPCEKATVHQQHAAATLQAISAISVMNISPLQELMSRYFKQVEDFTNLQASYSSQFTLADKGHQLEEAKLDLEKSLSNKGYVLDRRNTLERQSLQNLEEIKELKLRLEAAEAKQENFSKLLAENEEYLTQHDVEISKARERVSSIESAPAISDADNQALEMLRNSMEEVHQELKDFKWTPQH